MAYPWLALLCELFLFHAGLPYTTELCSTLQTRKCSRPDIWPQMETQTPPTCPGPGYRKRHCSHTTATCECPRQKEREKAYRANLPNRALPCEWVCLPFFSKPVSVCHISLRLRLRLFGYILSPSSAVSPSLIHWTTVLDARIVTPLRPSFQSGTPHERLVSGTDGLSVHLRNKASTISVPRKIDKPWKNRAQLVIATACLRRELNPQFT